MTPLAIMLGVDDATAEQIEKDATTGVGNAELRDKYHVNLNAVFEARRLGFFGGDGISRVWSHGGVPTQPSLGTVLTRLHHLGWTHNLARVSSEIMAGYWRSRFEEASRALRQLGERFAQTVTETREVRSQLRTYRRPLLVATDRAAQSIGVSAPTFRKYARAAGVEPEEVYQTRIGHGPNRRDHAHHLWAPEDIDRIVNHREVAPLLAKVRTRKASRPKPPPASTGRSRFERIDGEQAGTA